MTERITGFSVGMEKCTECIYESVLKDHPDYVQEPWGNRPVWAKYYAEAPYVKCMLHYGDLDYTEAICLKHIEEMKPKND